MIMKKFLLSCLLIGAVCAVPVTVSFAPSQGVLEMERRSMAVFPDLPEKIRTRTIRQYFKNIEQWFSDRIPGRAALVSVATEINDWGNSDINMKKCFRGKDGWLFLGNDYERTVDVLEGKWSASDELLERQVNFFSEMDRIARTFGAEFHILVGPNKSSIYPEFLPPVVFPTQERASVQLTQRLLERGLSVFDPAEVLKASKDKGILYWRTDTHWNELGTKIALEHFLQNAGQPTMPETEITCTGVRKGDLVAIGGYADFPLKEGDSYALKVQKSSSRDKRLFILGDSFSMLPLIFLKEMYCDVERVHMGELMGGKPDVEKFRKMLESKKVKPDVIFWIQVERSYVRQFD